MLAETDINGDSLNICINRTKLRKVSIKRWL